MKPFKTYCVRFAALICAAVLLSGCASARFTSTQTVPKITRQYPVKFCIQKDVQITGPKRRLAVDQQNTDATLRQITVGLDEVAAKRYPSLFSNEPDAIPIRVALDVKISSSIGYSLLLECATLAVMGGILPLPVAETYGFSLDVRVQNRPLGNGAFTQKFYEWISLTPSALIPIPGKSLKPKTSGIGEAAGRRTSLELSRESIVDALAHILQQRDLTPEIEEYIKSQRRF